MPDYMEIPNVPNSYYNKARNFSLTIYAYRKMNKSEILTFAEAFKRNMNWKTYPLNGRYETRINLQ